MKDKIVGILKDSDKALTIYDLEDKLHLLDVDELQELQTCLSKIEKELLKYKLDVNHSKTSICEFPFLHYFIIQLNH